MKNRIFYTAAALALFTFSSCTKDETELITSQNNSSGNGSKSSTTEVMAKAPVARPYKEDFNATSSISFGGDGFYNPGTGTGNSTHMGASMYSFNQKVVFNEFGQPVGSVAAPVNAYYASVLAAYGITNVPNTVSSISYDKQGNSVWFTSSTGTSLAPVSATRVNFSATLQVIGGTGKFSGATGQVTMNGYFNPQIQGSPAVITSGGTIVY